MRKTGIRKTGVVAIIIGIAVMVAAPAYASTQIDWTHQMNQESYWENELGAECTKFDDHSGFIPTDYDYVIVKGGTQVVIYEDVAANTQLDGPVDERGQEIEISWVMKCQTATPPTTTPTTTSTSAPTTTSTVPTTTTQPTTTTTDPATTTTDPEASTTTTAPETTTTPPTTPSTTNPPTLPFTGPDDMGLRLGFGALLVLLGSLFIGIGATRGES